MTHDSGSASLALSISRCKAMTHVVVGEREACNSKAAVAEGSAGKQANSRVWGGGRGEG